MRPRTDVCSYHGRKHQGLTIIFLSFPTYPSFTRHPAAVISNRRPGHACISYCPSLAFGSALLMFIALCYVRGHVEVRDEIDGLLYHSLEVVALGVRRCAMNDFQL